MKSRKIQLCVCGLVLALGVFGDTSTIVTNNATALYKRMLEQPTGETLMDVEMAFWNKNRDKETIAFLARELEFERRDVFFEDDQTDSYSLAAYFLSTMLGVEFPEGSTQPPCIIRCRLVPDATEVNRNFQAPHRIHIFHLTELGRQFALEKAKAHLRSADALPAQTFCTTNVTAILRQAIRQLQKAGCHNPMTPEVAPRSYYSCPADSPKFEARCGEMNGRFRYWCSYRMKPEPECAWTYRVRKVGEVRGFSDFGRDPMWNLLDQTPSAYTFEDVLKTIGKPYRSHMLSCRNCGSKDMRWEYVAYGRDDYGEAIRNSLTFSFAPNGQCTGWVWQAESASVNAERVLGKMQSTKTYVDTYMRQNGKETTE